MTVNFNDFNYNKYNFVIDKQLKQEKVQAKEAEEAKKSNNQFIGLEDDRDLLTQNAAQILGLQLGKFRAEDADTAETTNAILKSLGYDYKVSAAQVASVTNGVQAIVLPGMQLVEDGAVEAHIKDPNGPFAELFA